MIKQIETTRFTGSGLWFLVIGYVVEFADILYRSLKLIFPDPYSIRYALGKMDFLLILIPLGLLLIALSIRPIVLRIFAWMILGSQIVYALCETIRWLFYRESSSIVLPTINYVSNVFSDCALVVLLVLCAVYGSKQLKAMLTFSAIAFWFVNIAFERGYGKLLYHPSFYEFANNYLMRVYPIQGEPEIVIRDGTKVWNLELFARRSSNIELDFFAFLAYAIGIVFLILLATTSAKYKTKTIETEPEELTS